jgi:alpha-galactosidase
MAVYKIVDYLRKKHPKVTFEACASGGSRVDYGSLQHFDQFWLSDNTDGLDRLFIQEGYSYMYPIKAMRAWVTDCPNLITKKTTPLEFRFHSAMMGALGIGGNLIKYTKKDLTLAKKKIAEYKQIRHIIQDGYVYRLKSLTYSRIHAIQYVYKKEESVLFVFLPGQRYIDSQYLVKLKGLDPNKIYEIETNQKKYKKHGDYLMNVGIEFKLMGDFKSEIVHINAIR